MSVNSKNRIANIYRNTARYSLLILSILLFGFALISGSEDYGGGLKGIIKNSPNTIPWVGLILLIIVAWKRELTGGILIVFVGICIVYLLNFSHPNFFWITFLVTMTIPILGAFFIISWYLRKKSG